MDFEEDFYEEEYDDIEMPIAFHSEGISFELNDPDRISRWIEETASSEGKSVSAVNIVFCSDEYLYQMNVEYLQHDTYTDVITFQYAEPEDAFIEGDIFISIDRTNENAAQYGVSPEQELQRVIIHGVLHLLGYEDKTDAKKKIMTAKEDQYLAKLLLV